MAASSGLPGRTLALLGALILVWALLAGFLVFFYRRLSH